MRFGIVVFPGSNCDRDCAHVVERVLGHEAHMIWHERRELGGADVIIIPGGFSYGDYLRCGAVARLSPVMEEVARFAARGGPVLGICNGFQILLECGLLPGAMLRNRSLRFICRDARLRCATGRTPFTTGQAGRLLTLPIAHAEGNYFIQEDGLSRLWDNEQVVFQYVGADGQPSDHANPNGSLDHIAGICDVSGKVVGMMPHPERASEAVMGGVDGLALFEAVLEVMG
jgi:phosphoribosylformylglycinamidine synthase subunit PurQ / glutaminase